MALNREALTNTVASDLTRRNANWTTLEQRITGITGRNFPEAPRTTLENAVRRDGDTVTASPVLAAPIGHVYKDVFSFSTDGSSTGALVITFPVGFTNTMMFGTIKGYEYTGVTTSWELDFSGYNFSQPAWYYPSATISSSRTSFNRVRFGFNGTRVVLILGDVSTVWRFPRFSISDFYATHVDTGNFSTGWSSAFVTSLADITHIVEPVLRGGAPVLTTVTTGFAAGWSGTLRHGRTNEGLLCLVLENLAKTTAIGTAEETILTLPTTAYLRHAFNTNVSGLDSAGNVVVNSSVRIILGGSITVSNVGGVTAGVMRIPNLNLVVL